MSDFGDILWASTVEAGEPVRAMQEYECQTALYNGHVYNLDAMWRACGCPVGRGPRWWAELAKPLIEGLAAYFRDSDWFGGMPEAARMSGDPAELVFECTNVPTEDHPWQVGDLLSVRSVAWHYGRYLDRLDCQP